ncbi:Clavaminate synthase-like protein, partial [Eremomyces bilateralis CBS 781.70]
LPLIDISPFLTWKASPDSRAHIAAHLAAACRTHGAFYLTGHGIPRATTSHLLSLARRFFLENSPAEKAQIARQAPGAGDEDGVRGYQARGGDVVGRRRSWREVVDVYREGGGGAADGLLEGRERWPERHEEMREAVEGYVGRVRGVGRAVVRAMGVALGLGVGVGVLEGGTEGAWVLRLVGYPSLPEEGEENGEDEKEGDGDDGEQYSCDAHTDYGCVTLLLADATAAALQVQLKDGTWIDANPIDDAYIVTIGDIMERWTNGVWQSTTHRVIHRGDTYRVNVPFFFEPALDAVIRPLDACIKASGEPPKYGKIVYRDHLFAKMKGNF